MKMNKKHVILCIIFDIKYAQTSRKEELQICSNVI